MYHFKLVLAVSVWTSILAHPIAGRDEGVEIIGSGQGNNTGAGEFSALFTGNQAFRQADAALIQDLADNGQAPPYMFLGCADSRVSEGTIFNAKPGTLFAERNIANQFSSDDINARASIAYAVEELGVNHIIVMGHYGCGGVAAAIASPPKQPYDAATEAVQSWIAPIRELYRTSRRPEVAAMRKTNEGKEDVEAPGLKDAGLRALVEENIKNTVQKIASDSVISEHYQKSSQKVPRGSNQNKNGGDLFIHGWAYDIANGEIRDLGISVGPPGIEVPAIPFQTVQNGTGTRGVLRKKNS